MLFVLLQFTVCAAFIVIAGYFLTKCADRIAEITGWGRIFVGALLLAGATSVPEFMVDLKALQLGLPDLAVGDLLGSSLFNLLILSTLDFAFPSKFRRTAFSPAFLRHAISAVLAIILTALVGVAIVARFDLEILGASVFSWAVALMYFFGMKLIYLEGKQVEGVLSEVIEMPRPVPEKHKALMAPVLGYIAATLVIVAAAPFLVTAADDLAKLSGLGHTFIGTTLVALATSLPELVATLAAFRMGAPDLALGNIFGSNAFNMLLIFPLDLIYSESLFLSIKSSHALTALSVITAMSVAVMGQLYRKRERTRFSEPSSEIVFVIIILFLVLFYKINAA